MLEMRFELLLAPVVYRDPLSILSSFAYRRQTLLVVDVGHSGSKVNPIVDGYYLRSGSVASGQEGRWLRHVQKIVLKSAWNDRVEHC